MKLNKKLSVKQFILSHILILITGLIIIGALYYILNIQYKQPDNPFLAGPVTTAPKSLLLDLDQPDDNLLSYQSEVLVSGKTGALKEVLISTDSEDLVIKSKQDGSFSTEINLDNGVNRIMAVVFDSNGETRSARRTVYYSKEKI